MKMLSVVGAPPQFVKAVIVSRALREYNNTAGADSRIDEIILLTSQHYDLSMSEVFSREVEIILPFGYLDIGSARNRSVRHPDRFRWGTEGGLPCRGSLRYTACTQKRKGRKRWRRE